MLNHFIPASRLLLLFCVTCAACSRENEPDTADLHKVEEAAHHRASLSGEDTATNTQNSAPTATSPAAKSATKNVLYSSAPANAEVFFIEPQDGAEVEQEFRLVFGLRNMTVVPAGENVENSGHHHLLIDEPEDLDYSMPLPTTDQVVHFGKGQTETTLTLSPGEHKLQLLLGNFAHVPHDPPVKSEIITVKVRGN